MVVPVFRKVNDGDPGTASKYGAPDIRYIQDVLDGSHSLGHRIQASVIEGLPKIYTAIVRFEGSDIVARDVNGAVITSSTSAQTVLQNALNVGGHIYIGPGTYNTSSVLNVGSNSWVEADVNALIKGSGSHGLIKNSGSGAAPGNTNIIIQGGTWDGSATDDTASGPPFGTTGNIHLEFGGPYWVDHVRSIWANSEGIKVRNHSNAIITNNYVFHTRLEAPSVGTTGKAGIICATNGKESIIVNNIIEDSGGESIGCYNASARCIVVGNICRRLNYGRGHILLEGSGDSAQQGVQHVVANNTVDSKYYGINVMSNIGTVIANNHITNQSGSTNNGPAHVNAEAIRIYGVSEKVVITGNHIWDCETDGIFIGVKSSEVIISNNVIRNVGRLTADAYDGIRIQPGGGPQNNIKVCNNLIGDTRGTPRNRYAVNFIPGSQTMSNVWCYNNQAFSNVSGGVNIDWSVSSAGRMSGDCRFYNNSGEPGTRRIASPFNNTHKEVGMRLTGAEMSPAPSPSTIYTVAGTNVSMTANGGSGVSMVVEDSAGDNLVTSLNTPIHGMFLARGWRVTFGAFSSAPSVVIFPHG